MLNGAYRAGRAGFLALATLAAASLIDIALRLPAPMQDYWAVQALVEERPLIPDGLALRGLRHQLQFAVRNIVNTAIVFTVRLLQTFLGEFA